MSATNLLDAEQSWSVDLSGGSTQEYLGPPAVLGDIVLTVTAENLPPHPGDQRANPNKYVLNASGTNIDTGTVVWKARIHSGYFVPDPGQLSISERDGAALVALTQLSSASGSAAFLLDPESGEVRWSVSGNLAAKASGPYAIVVQNDRSQNNVVSLDLRTGQTSPSDKAGPTTWAYDDIYGDESYAIVRLEDYQNDDPTQPAFSSRYVRFSSTDGTIDPIAIAEDDIRYQHDVACAHEASQPVTLCQDRDGIYGVDSATGQTVWEHSGNARMWDATQYHGTVYGAVDLDLPSEGGTYQAVSLQTGEIINPDLGIHPIWDDRDFRPIKVNQYGAIGALDGECVWVPASS